MALINKLGELLFFVSEVAVSARMNTAYNGLSSQNPDTPRAAMWLVDMLHNFHGIGNALSENNIEVAVQEIDRLKSIWTTNQPNIERALLVNEHGYRWSVDEGINLLENIKSELLAG
jgi:hypothetical protein